MLHKIVVIRVRNYFIIEEQKKGKKLPVPTPRKKMPDIKQGSYNMCCWGRNKFKVKAELQMRVEVLLFNSLMC